eukprot:3904571-Rhodomonas_salina.2
MRKTASRPAARALIARRSAVLSPACIVCIQTRAIRTQDKRQDTVLVRVLRLPDASYQMCLGRMQRRRLRGYLGSLLPLSSGLALPAACVSTGHGVADA